MIHLLFYVWLKVKGFIHTQTSILTNFSALIEKQGIFNTKRWNYSLNYS